MGMNECLYQRLTFFRCTALGVILEKMLPSCGVMLEVQHYRNRVHSFSLVFPFPSIVSVRIKHLLKQLIITECFLFGLQVVDTLSKLSHTAIAQQTVVRYVGLI